MNTSGAAEPGELRTVPGSIHRPQALADGLRAIAAAHRAARSDREADGRAQISHAASCLGPGVVKALAELIHTGDLPHPLTAEWERLAVKAEQGLASIGIVVLTNDGDCVSNPLAEMWMRRKHSGEGPGPLYTTDPAVAAAYGAAPAPRREPRPSRPPTRSADPRPVAPVSLADEIASWG